MIPITVPFSIPERKQVTITIYDLTGRKLYRFFDREADPGFYEAPLDVAGLSGGVYIYRLRTNSANKTGKITLIGL